MLVFEKALLSNLKSKHAALTESMNKGNMSADEEKALHAAVAEFKKAGSY
jgi:F-type H+/Na+-transporting ATPase subunit alpha